MKKSFTLGFGVVAFCLSTLVFHADAQNNIMGNATGAVMLQGFNGESYLDTNAQGEGQWWSFLEEHVTEIGSTFDIVWLPPSGKAADGKGYLVTSYYYHSGAYGTENELKSLTSALHNYDVKVLADIVLNHRSSSTGDNYCEFDWKKDPTNPEANPDGWVDSGWDESCVCNDDNEFDGYPTSKCNPTGAADEGKKYEAARDLDHNNPLVKSDIKHYLNYVMSEYGYDGFRLDFVHGFNANHMQDYLVAADPYFAVGENFPDMDYSCGNMCHNQDNHRQIITDWISGAGNKSGAFDITLKGLLNEAFGTEGGRFNLLKSWNDTKPSGLLGWMPNYAVTFIDNHDTGPSPNENRWPFGSDNTSTKYAYNLMAAYAYLLTHPGIPCVFWDHYFSTSRVTDQSGSSYREQLDALIDLRKNYGVKSDAAVTIDKAETAYYAAYINSNVAMMIGWSNTWSPSGTGWSLATSGQNYKVWTKGSPVTVNVAADKVSGTYYGGTTLTLTASGGSGSGYSVYYTTNGSTPTTNSSRYTSPISINTNTTLKAIAVDGNANQSEVKTFTYVTELPNPFTVYFNRQTFSGAHIWSWNNDGNIVPGSWPGPAMTPVDGQANWYSYVIDSVSSANIIFANSAGSAQTATHLNIAAETCFDESGVVQCPVWTNMDMLQANHLKVYPNPVTDKLYISGISDIQKVEISNVLGKIVHTLYNSSASNSINLEAFEQGIYLITLTDHRGAETTKKIVKK